MMSSLKTAEAPVVDQADAKAKPVSKQDLPPPPAAGAHAASHLTNEDATPGSGALTSRSHASGKEVDGGAG